MEEPARYFIARLRRGGRYLRRTRAAHGRRRAGIFAADSRREQVVFELESVSCARLQGSKVSARLEPGEFVALCGLNGSGKSTLLEIMTGLLRDYAGTCKCEGREIRDWPARLLAQRV